MSTVVLNRSKAISDSITELYNCGYRRIAYAGINEAFGNEERLVGYMMATRKYGLEDLSFSIMDYEDWYDAGIKAMDQILEMEDRPDAVQFFTDIMAAAALSRINEKGLKVPEDIAIVGFDDRAISTVTWPPLSTIAQPVESVGLRAAKLLLEQIKSGVQSSDGETTLIEAKFVKRASV